MLIEYPDCIKIELIDKHAIMPERATSNASGYDVFVPSDFEPCYIEPHKDILIDLKIRLDIPSNWDCEVKNKSGIATKKKLIKGAQLIDSDYRGSIKIHLINTSDKKILIEPKMKIAQLVFRPVWLGELTLVDNIDTNTERGVDGFGSSGIKKN